MVSYAVPSGQLPVKPRSSDHLSPAVKAESPPLNQGSSGPSPQWQSHSTGMSGQPMSLVRVSSPHRHSSLPAQSSPKFEHQQHGERERDLSFEEFGHDRKRTKIQDSVHNISSQMQSQLLSPRGVTGSSGSALARDVPSPAAKYSEAQHSSDRSMNRTSSGSHLTSSVACNPLDEPSPLGLTLRKTPSLLDLISMKLAQSAGIDQGSGSPDALAQEAAKNRAGKCLVPTATAQDKLKASNFPASSLKIGTWERVSRYEGDLVGKCYYAKRKLVWEVLETGLKSKIEIQWSDISAMKASCPENLPGSFEIEVSRPPLFFRETNPQPRKHTLWQATSDFTGGQATVCKRHSLQFPEGVLNRHYEKLVQCDPRLKALVAGTLRPAGDFDHSNSLFDGQHQHLPPHQQLVHQNDSMKNQPSYMLPHMHLQPVNAAMSHVGIISDSKPEIRLLKMQSSDLASPSSVMDARVSDESGTSDNEDLRLQEELNEYDGMEMMYSNQSIGVHDLPDVKPGNNLYMTVGNALPPDRKILEEIAQVLLGEPASNISTDQALVLAARVGHMSAALAEEFHLPHPSSHVLLEGVGLPDTNHLHHSFNPYHVKSEIGLGADPMELMMSSSGNNTFQGRMSHRDPSFSSLMSCISKHGSASDLLMNLPRVASLPQLFEPSAQIPLGRYDPSLMRPSYLGSEKLR